MSSVMGEAETLIQTSLLGEAVDSSPALVFVADDEMRYIAVNRTACEVLGYTRDEILGMRVPDIARSPDAPMQYDQMLVRGGRDGISILTTKDGRELEFAYAASRTRVAKLEMFVAVGFVVGG
jgi:PAS domain S-box-containing protein